MKSGEVVIAYCGTLFVGRCSASDMVNHLKTFVAIQNHEVKLSLNLGMDRPDANVGFQNLLIKELKMKSTIYKFTFISE